MLPEWLVYLFSLADECSMTIGAVLAAIWLLALGCYIGEKAIAWQSPLVNVDRPSSNLVEKAPARL